MEISLYVCNHGGKGPWRAPGDGFLDELKDKFSIIEQYETEQKNLLEIKLLLEAEMIEPVLDFIENRYGLREGFRVIVTPVEAVIPRLEAAENTEMDEGIKPNESEAKRIYREELYEDINSVSSGGRTYILLVGGKKGEKADTHRNYGLDDFVGCPQPFDSIGVWMIDYA